jgi:opacity protein-like surface antigen
MRVKSLIPLAVAALAATVPAHAADWVGPYVGANFGFGGDNWQASESGRIVVGSATSAPATSQILSLSQGIGVSGALGGVQGGYLWRLGSLVIGGEVDADLTAITGSANAAQTNISVFPGGATSTSIAPQQVKTTADWLTTLRARAGFAQGNLLLYGTAGLAAAQVSYQSASFGGSFPSATKSQALVGWAAGAGIEYAATPSIGLRVEYLYVRLQDLSDSYTFTQLQSFNGNFSSYTNAVHVANPALNIVRVGLDWHF